MYVKGRYVNLTGRVGLPSFPIRTLAKKKRCNKGKAKIS